jgi:peptide methionine sulfoxide reductase msrA/msrB
VRIRCLCLVSLLVTLCLPAAAQPATQAPADPAEASMTNPSPAHPWRKLTPEEEAVIVGKGTEQPFTGKYTDYFVAGVYTCRRCGAMLYRSQDKFAAHCGWPAFDDEIPGAVTRKPDADGRRTEILCANCGAHLGHVFSGEHLTDKDVRHCVNSISLDFIPADKVQFGRAIFAGGCFWGVQYWLQQQRGVVSTRAGYTGGLTENPTYEQVCSHTTGHREAVEVLFDPLRCSFEDIAKLFFEIHDPTQADGQGPDIGPQYQSVIFYSDDQQKQTAQRLIDDLRARGLHVVTGLIPATHFWPAEDYHQDWYLKKGTLPYCHVRRKLW